MCCSEFTDFGGKNASMAEEVTVLDRLDREILGILRNDARISWNTLGDRVHLSANAASDRVRRLIRKGVIRRFTADIDQSALGRDLEAVVDIIVDHPAVSADEFVERALSRDEITWMSYMTGRLDFRMNVACAGTKGLDDFLAFLKESGARETSTTVVLRRLR
jgi:Lrp/AsnC family transcriptional regulator, leucine-responsive regulatory protein